VNFFVRAKVQQAKNNNETSEKVEDLFKIYKKKRNLYNRKVKQERQIHFSKQFSRYRNDSKRLWSIVNRSKGIVKGEVEDLSAEMFQPDNMAQFFHNRSTIATDINFKDIPNNFEQILQDNENFPNINIDINYDMIQEAMNFKAHGNPDPDGLSMLIWSKFYRFVPAARVAINRLFNLVFKKSLKIPGLDTHHIKLHLKVPEPIRQKDLRPVASLNSLPKRMLRILFKQLKDNNLHNFYSINDYSAPGKGADLAVLQTYENCERGVSGVGVKKDLLQTTLCLYDKSNAFNTYDRKELVRKLEIGGDARKLVVNSIVDQSSFCVRTKSHVSKPYELRTGGPQGQCGTAELFGSLTKNLTPPEIFKDLKYPQKVNFNRIDYVDDTSDVITASNEDIDKIHQQIEEKLISDCKNLGLKLNNEKTKTMTMTTKRNIPLQTEKFLGYQINNKINANSELPIFLDRLKKVTNTTRACSFLTKFDRLRIAKWQVLSVLWPITFLNTYLVSSGVAKIRKAINVTFKSASFLSMRTPTIEVENFLYGMSFEEYLDYRFLRVSDRFLKFGSNILDVVKFDRNKYRPKPRYKRGSFVDKYILIKNRTNIIQQKTLLSNKYKAQKVAYNNILEFQYNLQY
jgi:hypothetical protein